MITSSEKNENDRWSIKTTYLVMLSLFYAVVASQAIWSFSYKWTTVDYRPPFSLQNTLDGSTPKPFAYRVLIPEVTNFLVDVIPPDIKKILLERSRRTLGATIGANSNINDHTATSYGLILCLNFVFMFFTLFFLRGLAREFIDKSSKQSSIISDTGPILFSLLLAISYRVENGYIYDGFELFALSAYLYLVSKNYNFFALPVLVLAILNKETAIFFPVFGAIIRWFQLKDLTALNKKLISVSEFLVAIAGFMAVHWLLYNHPGSETEWHFPRNIKFWFSWQPWVAMTTPHLAVVPLPKPSNIIILIPMLMTIFGYWRSKPPLLKALLFASGLINLPLFCLFSYHDEFRNLSLMFPFIFLAATHSVGEYYSLLPSRKSPA